MDLCIMHLLQIAPAWKQQFLQGHIHCTWNQTSDSQLTSIMQALADSDKIELTPNASTWGRIAALPGNCRFHLIEKEVCWRLLAVDANVADAWHRQDTSQLPQVTNRKSSLLSSPLHQSFVCSFNLFHKGNCTRNFHRIRISEHLSSPGSFFRSSRSQFNKSSTTFGQGSFYRSLGWTAYSEFPNLAKVLWGGLGMLKSSFFISSEK